MTTPDVEDELTELVDASFPRVDLVGKGANGVPGFLIAKSESGGGLLPGEYVRGLITKATAPEPPRDDDTVTVRGTPAAIAKMIHEAAELAKAKAEYEAIVKAKYNADDLKRMAGNGEAMEDESYPIADEDDLHNAIHAVGRGGADHDAIRRHVIKRAKALGKSSMIPDSWAADGSIKEKVSKDMADIGPELDDGVDRLDPTVPLAAPEEDRPGDPTDPGSPQWEAIDAATACKWTAILSRARVAIELLAERELLEAAAGDGDDAEHAWELEDVCCAIDYAISVLAPFAVDEQSEADVAAEQLEAIGKAAAAVADPLLVIEALTNVRKAGRVLSSANEQRIRAAADSLNQVLATLPAATTDDGQQAAVTKEGHMPETDTQPEDVAKDASPDESARNSDPVKAGGTTGLGQPRTTGPAGSLPGDGPQAARPGDTDRQVIKADDDGSDGGSKLQAVFDQNGDLIGVVDPSAIQAVSGAAKPATDDSTPDAPAGDAADGATADDMTPEASADTGTAADEVEKSDSTPAAVPAAITEDVLKSIAEQAAATALAAQETRHQEVIAKMAADNGALAEELQVVKERLAVVEQEPAMPKVLVNGQIPPAAQLRGQDRAAGSPPVIDVAKGLERKKALYGAADAAEQNTVANGMQQDAITALAAIHAAAPRQ